MRHLLNLLNDVNEPEEKRQEDDWRQILVDEGLSLSTQRFASSAVHFRQSQLGFVLEHASNRCEFCAIAYRCKSCDHF